jgi:hypothetical protein
MSLTIQSAAYANPENTAAVIGTAERGAVLVSTSDTPDLWASMLAWGTPSAYEAPVVVPMEVGRVQAKIWLHRAGKLAAVQSYIEASEDAELQLWWDEANVFRRDNPHVTALSAGFDIDLDVAFTEAAAIS